VLYLVDLFLDSRQQSFTFLLCPLALGNLARQLLVYQKQFGSAFSDRFIQPKSVVGQKPFASAILENDSQHSHRVSDQGQELVWLCVKISLERYPPERVLPCRYLDHSRSMALVLSCQPEVNVGLRIVHRLQENGQDAFLVL
jgi:hypothetical protein